MKKLIISVVLSTPLFLTALPAFSAPPSGFESPALRTDVSGVNYNLPKVTKYAYWDRWHHWNRHRWHRWDRWHHWQRRHHRHHWHHW
ncbi:hypothetical protein OQJ19_09510 [Fluoribacter gormanii]|uniref:hypothetical protein n=1 Tax=Fluoribacter gormanii TaxID=464 RepID=UPI002242DAEF|nr:hypothetical protein [Fluoribacter gormanii]MCW8470887.1 hypothetical protein [Fluoribacter gormanii]